LNSVRRGLVKPAFLAALLIPLLVAMGAGLVAMGLLPAIAGAGQVVNKFDSQFAGAGSTTFRLPALPQRSTIFGADSKPLATLFEDENRVYVPLSEINQVTRRAVLAIEDHSYYQHGPLDVTSIVRAAVANIKAGHIVQGGSTIAQQLIKNTITGSAETFARKFQEAQDAIRLEKTYTKNQILELYMNVIYLGHRVYGIGTAAEYYFGRPVKDLTLSQAATLAGMIASPVGLDPIEHRAASTARRNVVLGDMLKYGWITGQQYGAAVKSRITLSARGRTANTAGPEPQWVAYIVREFLADPRFGATEAERRRALFQGGLKIYTTLQPKLQAAARTALHENYPNPGLHLPADPEGALVSVVPQTGAIVAMVSNNDPKRSQIDLASQGGRSTGSAFKAFTLAAAFEQGISPDKTYDSSSPVKIPESKCINPNGPWTPGNAEPGGGGMVDLRTATAGSINVVFAQLIADVGAENVARVAQEMGLTGYIPPVCAITLGAVSVSPLSMASAYSTLPNGGVHCSSFAINRVVDSTGNLLFQAKPNCTRSIPAGVAAQVTQLLEGVISGGTGTAAQLPDFGIRPEAGKTGTGEQHDDAWFMGYIAQLTAGVWIGYQRNETTSLAGVHGSGGFGGTLAAPVWHDFMAAAEQGLSVEQFPTATYQPKQGTVPYVVGERQALAVKTISSALFSPVVQTTASTQPAGTVVSQDPSGGSKAPLGSSVVIFVSTGKAPQPSPKPSPSPKQGTVPGVVGLSQAAAAGALRSAGFGVAVTFKVVHGQKKNGIVLGQTPGGGSKAPPGSTVTIVVGKL